MIRDVLITGCSLLRQVVGPSQQVKNGTNQILLCLGFVGVLGMAEVLVTLSNPTPEGFERVRLADEALPIACAPDALCEEVMGEQLAGHVRFSAPGPVQRIAVAWSLRFRKAMLLDCQYCCPAVPAQQRIIAEGAVITLGW